MSFHARALAALLAAGVAPFLHAEGLSFADAVSRAASDAPAVAAGELRVDAAQRMGRAAGRLPDPQLVVGVDNLPLEGAGRYSLSQDPMTMQRIGLMQELPNHGRRAAERAQASGEVELARSGLRLARQSAAEHVAVAWITRHALERQLAQLEALAAENRLLGEVMGARLAAAQATPAEVLAVRQEEAGLAARRDALQARREQAISALREWIGAAADDPLAGEPPELPFDAAALQRRVELHPAITELDAEAQVLDSQVAAARAAGRPDWSVGLMYQRRAAAFGDMVSLQVGVGLPVFRGSRQAPRLQASRLQRRALDAQREARLREHQRMLEEELAEERRLRQALQRQATQLLPLAEEKVALMQASWSAGRTALVELLAARRERLEVQLQRLELQGALQGLLAGLHYRYATHEAEQP